MEYINKDELLRVLSFVKRKNYCDGFIPDFVDLVSEYIETMPSIDSKTDYGTDLQEFMRNRRDVINMTRQKLADKCGITYGTISNYETGDATPSLLNAQAIAEALGCEVAFRER